MRSAAQRSSRSASQAGRKAVAAVLGERRARWRRGPPWTRRRRRRARPGRGPARTADCRAGTGSSSRASAWRARGSRSGGRSGRSADRSPVICGSMARSLGRKMRVGQLSTMAGAMLLPSMSDSDWVAKTTEAFFLRSVFSHSRSCCAKAGIVEDQPAFVDDEQRRPAVEPAFDAVEEIGQHGGRRAGADQALGLEGLDRGRAELLALGVEQPAGGAADAIGLQRLLQRRRLQQHREAGDACAHRPATRPATSAPTRHAPWRSGRWRRLPWRGWPRPIPPPRRARRGRRSAPAVGARPNARTPAERLPPRSCQSPPMASAAVRIEPPKSKAKIWLLR